MGGIDRNNSMTPQAPVLAQPQFPNTNPNPQRHNQRQHQKTKHKAKQQRIQQGPPRLHPRPDPPGDESIVNNTTQAFPLSTPTMEPMIENIQLHWQQPPPPRGRPIPTLFTPTFIQAINKIELPRTTSDLATRIQQEQPMAKFLTKEIIQAIDKHQDQQDQKERLKLQSTTDTYLTPRMIREQKPFNPFLDDTQNTTQKIKAITTSKTNIDNTSKQPTLDECTHSVTEHTLADIITPTTAATAEANKIRVQKPSFKFRLGTYLRQIMNNMATHIGSAANIGTVPKN